MALTNNKEKKVSLKFQNEEVEKGIEATKEKLHSLLPEQEVTFEAELTEEGKKAFEKIVEEAAKEEPMFKTAFVDNCEILNVRDGYNGNIIGTLKRYDKVDIIYIDGPWTEIVWPKQKAYVMTEFLNFK